MSEKSIKKIIEMPKKLQKKIQISKKKVKNAKKL